MNKLILAAGLALAVLGGRAEASTFTFDLIDHPAPTLVPGLEDTPRGARLDALDSFLSFEVGGANAQLIVDEAASTATITGTARRIAGPDDPGALFTIRHEFTGLTLLGNGFFRATGGSGYLHEVGGAEVEYLLESQTNARGLAFVFDNQRPSLRDFLNIAELGGHGWLNLFTLTDDGERQQLPGNGFNDFLFAALTPVDDAPPDGVVPLPAAGWLLFASLGLLGFMKGRRA